jgi:hypothetical protein
VDALELVSGESERAVRGVALVEVERVGHEDVADEIAPFERSGG